MAEIAVVFGGSGFLGSHIADALSDSGYRVRIFDKVKSPYLRSGQEMILGDILNLDQVKDAVTDTDVLYHLAGISDLDEAHNKPLETANLNVIGTVHTLKAATEEKIKRYVFASTVYVYSNRGSFYRASKQSAEKFIETYHEVFGLNYTILRYGSLYGRRADYRNGIYRWLDQALKSKTIIYPGKGDELREYIHVTDAAKASVKILESEYANQHIILTGNEKMRVRDLLKMISEILGNEIRFEFSGDELRGHYSITPYSYNPTIGKRLVLNHHIDIGQGLLDCLAEIHLNCRSNLQTNDDWLVNSPDDK